MKIDLHIERLVLDGFAANTFDGDAVRRALSLELARLLQASPSSGMKTSAIPLLKATALPLGATARADSLGAGVARALHGALDTAHTSELTTPRRTPP
ncbi:MAG: hypothetical protein ABIQ70_14635 [Dokdonella sp.]